MIDIDEVLVRKSLSGDIKSFETLVARYQHKIFSFIYRMVMSDEDSKDLTQEVFLQVYRSLAQFRGESKFSTWIYRVAANKSLDFLRRAGTTKTEKFDEHEGVDRLSNNLGDPEHTYLYEEKVRRLRRMISGLPDRYKIVLIMFHYENMSYQQIADTLEIPLKTVATRLYRAKIILKQCLGGETGEL